MATTINKPSLWSRFKAAGDEEAGAAVGPDVEILLGVGDKRGFTGGAGSIKNYGIILFINLYLWSRTLCLCQKLFET